MTGTQYHHVTGTQHWPKWRNRMSGAPAVFADYRLYLAPEGRGRGCQAVRLLVRLFGQIGAVQTFLTG